MSLSLLIFFHMKLTRRKFLMGGLLAGSALTGADIFFEKNYIDISRFSLGNPHAESRFRLFQISDLHLNVVHSGLKTLCGSINELKPDLLVFTGDSVDTHEGVQILDELLGLIHHAIPKLAILGNWEYWARIDIDALAQVYSRHNCKLLINQSTQLRVNEKLISVTGIDDYISGCADFQKAIKDYTQGDFHLLLTHCPEHRDRICEEYRENPKIDLVLSGHTHGGQINLFGFAPSMPRGCGRYMSGWYKDKEPHLFVSKGIGTSILPVRFGARAESTLFEIGL